jgi:hypothetical protein
MLPFLMYISLLRPFSYVGLLPLFFFVLLMVIPRESGTVMFIGSIILILFMNYIQLTSPSIILGFLLSGIFATRVKEAEDLEVLVFCLIWLALLSFLGAPYAIYIFAATLILFSMAYKKSFVLILLLLLMLTPISLKNWKWWELIGTKPVSTIQKQVYNRQIDPVLKMAGENDEGAGTISDNSQVFEPRYILQMDYVLNFLLMLTSLLFIISFLRVLRLAVRFKKTVLPDFVKAGIMIIVSFLCISSMVKLYQAPMFKTEMVKREVFKFTNRDASIIAATGDPLQEPKIQPSFPYQTIHWNLDTVSRLTGIIILLVSLFLLYKLAKTLFETSISADKTVKSTDNVMIQEKAFRAKCFDSFHGSELLKKVYERYREAWDKDPELTPYEFLHKHPNTSLKDLTAEYIFTEYGLKPTLVPDETIIAWIKRLEQTLT